MRKMYGFIGCVKLIFMTKPLLDSVNHRGNAYIKKRIRHCFNPRCPTCYLSWATREAKFATWRIKEASKKYGKAEHIICSVPKSEYSMFEEGYSGYLQGRARLLKILNNRGIIGGGVIFHGFRFANAKESRIKGVPFGWYWSPHWHVVGFLADGYSLCRNCVRNCETDREYCKSCSKGYEGRTRRAYDSDFWILRLQRSEINPWTFFYQPTIQLSFLQESVFTLTWFGVCGIRALKLDKSSLRKMLHFAVCGKCTFNLFGIDRARITAEFLD